jgi:hypothetical protein
MPLFGSSEVEENKYIGWVWVTYRRQGDDVHQWTHKITGTPEANARDAVEQAAEDGIRFLQVRMNLEIDDFNYPAKQSLFFNQLLIDKDSELINQFIRFMKRGLKEATTRMA